MFSLRPQNRRHRAPQRAGWSPARDPLGRAGALGCGSWCGGGDPVAGHLGAQSAHHQRLGGRVASSGSHPMDVERAVKESVGGKGLVSADLAQVRTAVRALPWVDTVSVAAQLAARSGGDDWRAGSGRTLGRQRVDQYTRRPVHQCRHAYSPGAAAALRSGWHPDHRRAALLHHARPVAGGWHAHHRAAPGCPWRLGAGSGQRGDRASGTSAA